MLMLCDAWGNPGMGPPCTLHPRSACRLFGHNACAPAGVPTPRARACSLPAHRSVRACSLQAHSIGEVEDFIKIASALLINVGTLSEEWVGGMRLAAKAAAAQGKPWVLDPVGCGATPFRSQVGQHVGGAGRRALSRGGSSQPAKPASMAARSRLSL